MADHIVQLPTHHVLQNQSYCVLVFVDVENVDNAGMVQSDEHVDLVFGF